MHKAILYKFVEDLFHNWKINSVITITSRRRRPRLRISHSLTLLFMCRNRPTVNDPIYGKMHLSTTPTILCEERNRSLAYQLPLKSPVNHMLRFLFLTAKGIVCVVCVIETINCIILFDFKTSLLINVVYFVKDNNLCKIYLSKGNTDSVCKSPYICKIIVTRNTLVYYTCLTIDQV